MRCVVAAWGMLRKRKGPKKILEVLWGAGFAPPGLGACVDERF